jgi:DNA-binding NtrC family response regulator
MAERGTWEEAVEPPQDLVPVLSFVLRYDDLLAERHAMMPIGEGEHCALGRAEEPGDDLVQRGDGVLVDDKWASGRHAVLRRKGTGSYAIEDGESRNGTYVNGERVHGKQRIFDGDVIEIGHTLLCFRHVDRTVLARLRDDGPVRLGPTASQNPEIAAIVTDLDRIAPSRQSVLVLGETGVGKEIVGRMLHARSGRAGAFCAVDCGAVPESLFEATFFGHRRGAFTGATDARTGEIERADGGTLFLDEVGNMPASCQGKLLRAIEDGSIAPLGGSDTRPVDVRFVAATNADPFAKLSTFRGDLVERLAAWVARIPPLRRRREDLGALAAHALRDAGATRASMTAAAGRAFFADPFPGNVRQLRAMLQTAAILAAGEPIDLRHLPKRSTSHEPSEAPGGEPTRESASTSLGRTTAPDAKEIEAALARTGGNVIRAAGHLEVRPRQLYRWIEKLKVPLDRFRARDGGGSE